MTVGLIDFFIKLSFLFILLLVLTHVIYYRFLRFIHPSILSGSIVMGAGAFLWLCLPEFGLPHFWMQITVLELAIVWVYLVLGLAHRAIEGHLLLDKNADRLGLGIWVAGTAIVGLLLDKVEPLLHGSILFLALVVLMLGTVYFIMIGKWMYSYLASKAKLYVNSLVLCSTVTIQVCVLFEVELFQRTLPIWIYQIVILLGYLFYAVGLYGLLRYFLFTRTKYRYVCFTARSTMLYSAMAVTGLAMVSSRTYPDWLIDLTWYWTAALFVFVECIEINRLILYVKTKGMKHVLFHYKNAQWLRIFSLAVIYAFALTRYHIGVDNSFTSLVMYSGLCLLTILFLFECFIAVLSLFQQNSRLAVSGFKHRIP